MRAKDGKLIPLDSVGLAQTSPTLGVKRAVRTMIKPRKPKDAGKGCRGWYTILSWKLRGIDPMTLKTDNPGLICS